MTQIIPFEFDPSSDEYEEDHLVWEKAPAGHNVSWPVLGARLFVPEKSEPRLEAITRANNGAFRNYGQSGFTLGDYSEFFVSMPHAKYVGFKMGHIEATFGQATPLAAMVFGPYLREEWFGTWDTILSLRIIGAGSDQVEVAFLNAMSLYEERFAILPAALSNRSGADTRSGVLPP